MTLACEDGNIKLVEVVTVANVDAEKRVDDSLVQIWKLKFGRATKCLFRQTDRQIGVCDTALFKK